MFFPVCCVNVFSDTSDYCEVLARWAEIVINRYEHLMSLATCEQHERYVDGQMHKHAAFRVQQQCLPRPSYIYFSFTGML